MIISPLVTLSTKFLGIALLVVGIAGFFVDGMLATVYVSTNHNILHIIAGLIAIGASKDYNNSRKAMMLLGIVFAVAAVVGLVTHGYIFKIFYTNAAGVYTMMTLAAFCLVIGFGSSKR